ncbi:helix-turn-helix domain-containing protein [Candidatus Gracilibacteria bacterium]|nr:helix-turn-helix domain-containing protein [Candidatus Gracilibacteria bacterium]
MSIMYKYTRQEVADKMGISTRSVDRYIKAGKLRAKKEGKVVYIKGSDVENLMGNGVKKQEVIVEPKIVENFNKTEEKNIVKNDENVSGTLGLIYKDLKKELIKKDEIIQNLSMRVGKAEEIAKNSVSLLDFKKSQYLLEESKTGLLKEVELLEKEKEKLSSELKYEKTSNIILIIFVVVLLVLAGVLWFIQI